MEKTQRYSKRKEREERFKRQKVLKFLSFFIRLTIRCTWTVFVATLLVLGFVNMYDIYVEDSVPEISTFHEPNDNLLQDCPDLDLVENFNEERAWLSLKPALKILDVVCPQASAWARDQKESNKIIWVSKSDGAYARYDQVRMRLIINADMFALINSERACTIAHEFRHSRQNISKSWKSACYLLLRGKRNPDIIEDDAYFYESKVRDAINGR